MIITLRYLFIEPAFIVSDDTVMHLATGRGKPYRDYIDLIAWIKKGETEMNIPHFGWSYLLKLIWTSKEKKQLYTVRKYAVNASIFSL